MTAAEVKERNELYIAFGELDKLIPDNEPEIQRRALSHISDYNATRAGLSYQELGYTYPDGTLPAVVMYRHKLIHSLIRDAEKRRDKRK